MALSCEERWEKRVSSWTSLHLHLASTMRLIRARVIRLALLSEPIRDLLTPVRTARMLNSSSPAGIAGGDNGGNTGRRPSLRGLGQNGTYGQLIMGGSMAKRETIMGGQSRVLEVQGR